MDKNDNILKQIRELLGGEADSFNILEDVVDVEIQVAYLDFLQTHQLNPNRQEVLESEAQLYDETIDINTKMGLLADLASVDEPQAYRILERYAKQPSPQLKGWALMALQENRILLEAKFIDSKQVFISTGLGGKGGKLRYFVVLLPMEDRPFTETEQKLISSEFEFTLKRFQSELEDVKFVGTYATMHALVPLGISIREPFVAAIAECNSLGEFIKLGFMITNVKTFSVEELEQLIKSQKQG